MTLRVLKNRRSCRAFKPDMVKEEDLKEIIEAGTYAPNGMGMQSPIIIAVTDKKLRDRIAEENRKIGGWKEGFDPFYGAPAILIVLADKSMPTYKYDGTLVMGNLMNAAESLGVNSIWIHRAKEEFESDFGKKILKDLGIDINISKLKHNDNDDYPDFAFDVCKSVIQSPNSLGILRKENYVYYVK